MPAVLDRLDAAQPGAGLDRARALGRGADEIDELNVYPVPDGDTGTNLYLTFDGRVDAVARRRTRRPAPRRRDLAAGVPHRSSGPPAGARGNSGVILGQLLRGMCRRVSSARGRGRSTPAAARRRLRRRRAAGRRRGRRAGRRAPCSPSRMPGPPPRVDGRRGRRLARRRVRGRRRRRPGGAGPDARPARGARPRRGRRRRRRRAACSARGAATASSPARWPPTTSRSRPARAAPRDEWRRRHQWPPPAAAAAALRARPSTRRRGHGDGRLRGDVPARRARPRRGPALRGALDALGDSLVVVGGADRGTSTCTSTTRARPSRPASRPGGRTGSGSPTSPSQRRAPATTRRRWRSWPCAPGPGSAALLSRPGPPSCAAAPAGGRPPPSCSTRCAPPGRAPSCCCPTTPTALAAEAAAPGAPATRACGSRCMPARADRPGARRARGARPRPPVHDNVVAMTAAAGPPGTAR